MVNILSGGLIGMVFVSGSVFALDKSDIRTIVLENYPGARVVDIDSHTHDGVKIFEVDFQHGNENFQAILSLEGDFIKVGVGE